MDDGEIHDFRGDAGHECPDEMDQNSDAVEFTDPADLALFMGTGTVMMDAFGTAQCTSEGTANVITQCITQAGVTVTVSYSFGGDCVRVPRRKPGSLLLCPEFDNRDGMRTIATVTNTNPDAATWVHFIYIGRFASDYDGSPIDLDCQEFDRMEHLTPNDTITVFTSEHNPQQDQGFCYAFAVDAGGNPISFNHLIGQQMRVDGYHSSHYAINPIDFRSDLAEGELTDLDGDGVRDLNDQEYEFVPEEVYIPRFIGQDSRNRSEVVFIALSGGSQFTTTAAIMLYNDNEEAFSANHTFKCWDRTSLTQVSAGFKNSFLKDATNHNYYESLGDSEYGWYKVRGQVANSGIYSIQNPSVYVVHIAKRDGQSGADLPFEGCGQAGHLIPHSVTGDNEE